MLTETDEYVTEGPDARHADFPPGTRVVVDVTVKTPLGPPDAEGMTTYRCSWEEKTGVVHGFRTPLYGKRRYWVKFDDGTEQNEILTKLIGPAV